MSRQFAFPMFGAVAALLSFSAIPASSSYAETCLAAPNAPAPQGSHWFYRVERPSLRKCWRLVKRDEQPQRAVKRAAPQPEPARVPQPSLGASLIADRIVRRPDPSVIDPLAPIRRMSQAEKIAFFS